MWELHNPWYELVFRATCVYFISLVLFRFWGKKHLGEMAPFDLILLLYISEAISPSLTNEDSSLTAAVIVVLTFLLWNTILEKFAFRFHEVEKILEGEPVIIIDDGEVKNHILEDEQITPQELEESLRLEGITNPQDVKRATLETNGRISVIPFENKH